MKKILKIVFASALMSASIAFAAFAGPKGWIQNENTWNYLESDGSLAKDTWKKSNDNWYYLNSEGKLAVETLIEDGSKYYYVNSDGAMVKDCWVAVPAEEDENVEYRWYYFGSNGAAYTQTGSNVSFKTIGGKKYDFDEEGKMLYGYVDESGEIIDSEEPIINALYYFGTENDGELKTGWLCYNDSIEDYDKDHLWFYFMPSNGKKVSDQVKTINGKKYEFDSNGVMTDEWSIATAGTASNYYADLDDGAQKKNTWVWAIPSESINAQDHEDDEYRWFYMDGSGKAIANKTKKINGKWYAFDEDGIMKTEFVELSGDKASNATFVSQFKAEDVTADEIYARFDDSDTALYYFSNTQSDGSMKTGNTIKIELSDDTYTFGFKSKTGAALNGVEKNKLYRCSILQTAGDTKYAVKKYYNGSEYVSCIVNSNGTILKGGSTGKNDNDEYYAVAKGYKAGAANAEEYFALFSGDDAAKAASYFAKHGTLDGIDEKYSFVEESIAY